MADLTLYCGSCRKSVAVVDPGALPPGLVFDPGITSPGIASDPGLSVDPGLKAYALTCPKCGESVTQNSQVLLRNSVEDEVFVVKIIVAPTPGEPIKKKKRKK